MQVGHALATLLAVIGVAGAAGAREALRVHADAAFVNVGLVRGPDALEVSGGLRDEVGQPVQDADVTLSVAEDGANASGCRAGERVDVTSGLVSVHTDALGFFCIRLPSADGVEGSSLAYAGDRFHGAASATVPRETGQRRLSLHFESATLVASLDSPSLVVWVTTAVADGGSAGDPVRLVLLHQPSLDAKAEVELGATDVAIGGTAKFDVDSRVLGAPGTGKLIVRFRGSGVLAPAAETALLERRATAHLSLARAPGPSDPSQGVALTVGVSSAAGAVSDGFVEATSEDEPVGLGPVSAGAANVVATFTASRNKPASIVLRYVPSSGGWTPGEPLAIDVPVRPPSPWGGTPWLFAAAAVAYWVMRSWKRPARAVRTRTLAGSLPTDGRPALELIEADASQKGFRGRVVDAHDGTPIAGARVSIIVPAFDGEGVAATQTTSAEGAFHLPHVAAARNDGARLVATAPHHATLSERAPRDGVLAISLVSRRRALLDRLVAWARRGGHAWAAGHKEPTPLELAAVAGRRKDRAVADWAISVTEAAYGPVPPDERRESELIAREPPSSKPR